MLQKIDVKRSIYSTKRGGRNTLSIMFQSASPPYSKMMREDSEEPGVLE